MHFLLALFAKGCVIVTEFRREKWPPRLSSKQARAQARSTFLYINQTKVEPLPCEDVIGVNIVETVDKLRADGMLRTCYNKIAATPSA